MLIAGIVRDSIVDGVGIRDVIFFQGCLHRCKGCHNPQSWSYTEGTEMSVDEILDELKNSSNDVTISGGEPLFQISDVCNLIERLSKIQNKRCWLYTGYCYETLPPQLIINLSKYVDVLVDGKFVEELKDPNLRFRGSSNQRLIDLPKSVKANKIILWEDNI